MQKIIFTVFIVGPLITTEKLLILSCRKWSYTLSYWLATCKKSIKSNGFIRFRPWCSVEVMSFSNTHPIPSSVVNIDLTLALPSFLVFSSVSVQWFEMIFDSFHELTSVVTGRSEHGQERVSNIYSQSERIVQGSVKNTDVARILFWWVTWQVLLLPSNWDKQILFSFSFFFLFFLLLLLEGCCISTWLTYFNTTPRALPSVIR